MLNFSTIFKQPIRPCDPYPSYWSLNFILVRIICDYGGKLLDYKKGKTAYEQTPETAMGYMFMFKHQEKKFWRDATEEVPGVGRLINHSKVSCKRGKRKDTI
jgi:hypothetical protein